MNNTHSRNDMILADRRNLYSTPIANWSMGNTFTIPDDDFSDFAIKIDGDDSGSNDNEADDFSGFQLNDLRRNDVRRSEFSGFRDSMSEIQPPNELRKILDDMKNLVEESRRAIDRSGRLIGSDKGNMRDDLSMVDSIRSQMNISVG